MFQTHTRKSAGYDFLPISRPTSPEIDSNPFPNGIKIHNASGNHCQPYNDSLWPWVTFVLTNFAATEHHSTVVSAFTEFVEILRELV